MCVFYAYQMAQNGIQKIESYVEYWKSSALNWFWAGFENITQKIKQWQTLAQIRFDKIKCSHSYADCVSLYFYQFFFSFGSSQMTRHWYKSVRVETFDVELEQRTYIVFPLPPKTFLMGIARHFLPLAESSRYSITFPYNFITAKRIASRKKKRRIDVFFLNERGRCHGVYMSNGLHLCEL